MCDLSRREWLKLTGAGVAGSDQLHIVQGFYAQSRAFIDAVKSGKQLHNNLRDSVKSMQLVDLIYQNAINKDARLNDRGARAKEKI